MSKWAIKVKWERGKEKSAWAMLAWSKVGSGHSYQLTQCKETQPSKKMTTLTHHRHLIWWKPSTAFYTQIFSKSFGFFFFFFWSVLNLENVQPAAGFWLLHFEFVHKYIYIKWTLTYLKIDIDRSFVPYLIEKVNYFMDWLWTFWTWWEDFIFSVSNSQYIYICWISFIQ